MESDEELEDEVVREIDVYLTSQVEENKKVYVLQYPLRPEWRPYDVEATCEAVRIKTRQNKMELDLRVDSSSATFNDDANEQLKNSIQTLTSKRGTVDENYAIGILRGNQLHLNPIHSVIQLRPSFDYLDRSKEASLAPRSDDPDSMADEEQELNTEKEDFVPIQVNVLRKESESQEQSRLMSHEYLKKLEASEEWVTLNSFSKTSADSQYVKELMMTAGKDCLPFTLPQEEYIDTLTPGKQELATGAVQTEGVGTAGLSQGYLKTLPLERRLRTLLQKAKAEVFRYSYLRQSLPGTVSETELLDQLQRMAILIRGCWVASSALKFEHQSPLVLLRDYFLYCFSQSPTLPAAHVSKLKVNSSIVNLILPKIAKHEKDGDAIIWRFYEADDTDFLSTFPEIAGKEHRKLMAAKSLFYNKALSYDFTRLGASPSAAAGPVPFAPTALPGGSAGLAGRGGQLNSMSEETKSVLPKVLRSIFEKHNVLSFQQVQQCLRQYQLEVANNTTNLDMGLLREARLAALAVNAPVLELRAILSDLTFVVHGVHFLKELGDSTIDPFRACLIELLKVKPRSDPIRKSELAESVKLILKVDLPGNLYTKVMKELCYSTSKGWLLKEGDGRHPGS